MQALPNEMIVQIFSFLPLETVVCSVIPTCRLFKELVLSNAKMMKTRVVSWTKKKAGWGLDSSKHYRVETDLFGDSMVHKKISWTTLENEGTEDSKGMRRGKRRVGLWEKIQVERKITTVCRKLYDGERKICHEQGGSISNSWSGIGIARVFYPVEFVTLECKGKEYQAYIEEIGGSTEKKLLAHCCPEHQGEMPDSLFCSINKPLYLWNKRSTFLFVMESLPAEVLVEIFSFVDFRSLSTGVVQVCSRFHSIVFEHKDKMQRHVEERGLMKGTPFISECKRSIRTETDISGDRFLVIKDQTF
ncbi:hypothetical protein GMAR_ORF279 [Golden Marseillevirus]|uniref:hypothetical protein n=1 Tax=Golden Marseillevirus TaxID=1720526 RepID=UPI000877ABC1|nr:hypothetical protein GMAR_ORF279 [Golden Marseillevirus]ALX27653.1 hypothetical protein GMAR_ORF279 [Golden Marseillevirus]